MAFYPKIFISWGMPDAHVVDVLVRRLKALFGPDNIFEYRHMMGPGDKIDQKVRGWIKSVDMAVVFYSDETADREWVTTEVAWCIAEVAERKMKLVGVDVNGGKSAKKPMLIEANNLLTVTATEESMYRLADDIATKSGLRTPQILPAALFAMTAKDAKDIFGTKGLIVGAASFDKFRGDLCEALGMGTPPELHELLLQRYHDRPEDMRPFGATGPTIIEVVDERLEAVNLERQDDAPPLLVRWVHDELQSNDQMVADEAVDLWRSGESLLIIDSLSTWNASIRTAIANVPDWNRTAVLWLPPFSQQVGGLEGALDDAISMVQPVRTAFREADRSPTRTVTHDPVGRRSLGRWIHRVLHSIGEPSASDAARAEMAKFGGTGMKPRDMFRKPS